MFGIYLDDGKLFVLCAGTKFISGLEAGRSGRHRNDDRSHHELFIRQKSSHGRTLSDV
jgi:hypothetical protein